MTVGFDSEKELAVKLECIDYEEKGRHNLVYAFVTFEDAYDMAKQLNVRLTELPLAIKKHCGYGFTTLLPSQMEKCFKDVLDFIISCGIQYKLMS